MKKNRFVKGVCGFIIAALLLGVGGFFLSENTLTANASLNGDLASIDAALTSVEATEDSNEEKISKIDYIVSDDVIVQAVSKDNITIEAKKYIAEEIGCTLDGYTTKGLVGFNIANATTNGVNRTYCSSSRMCFSKGNLAFNIRNRGDADAKVKVTGYILYVKTK